MRYLRMTIGVAFWCVALFGLWWCVEGRLVRDDSVRDQLLPDLWQYATASGQNVDLQLDEPTDLAVGDPIFIAAGGESFRQVGEITKIRDHRQDAAVKRGHALSADALFYPSAPSLSTEARLTYHQAPQSMEWVLKTMLPPQKRLEIAEELSLAFEQNREEVIQALRPLVEDSLRRSISVLEEDLAVAIRNHRQDLSTLGEKYQKEIVQEEIVPMVRQEIWPIVLEHAEPTADKVGQEIWDRVSLWRFGWRFVYDKSPLPKQDLTRKEWQRFLDKDAMPILEEHSDEFVQVVQKIMADSARNSKVRETLRRNLLRIVDDPELQAIVWQIIEEAVIDNPRLRTELAEVWKSDEARAAFRLAGRRLEPTVRRIGVLLFGSQEGGITPEFAQVLRNQILHKDRRWLILEPAEGPYKATSERRITLQVQRGAGEGGSPFAQAETAEVARR